MRKYSVRIYLILLLGGKHAMAANSLKKILRSMFIPARSRYQKSLSEFDKPFDPKNTRSSKVKFSELYCKFYGMSSLTIK